MKKHAAEDSEKPSKYGNARDRAGVAHGAEALGEIDSAILLDAVLQVVTCGDAIAFGCTKDGGAVAITMFSEGTTDKIYVSTVQELEDALRVIEETARAA